MFSSNQSGKQGKKEPASVNNLLNIIGPGTKLKGDLVSEGDFRVDGVIEGHVTVKQRLVLGDGGSITGDIDARDATIAGFIKGNITVAETLVLKSNSKIDGDIATGKIIIESGASFNGRCSMNAHITQVTTKSVTQGSDETGQPS
ncbi:MAG: polymer-forming cytoskeletal protein [Sphingomonadales bacterium]|nr:polymer-forming cytoskeletal protein [Sphingomonadales bacterium]